MQDRRMTPQSRAIFEASDGHCYDAKVDCPQDVLADVLQRNDWNHRHDAVMGLITAYGGSINTTDVMQPKNHPDRWVAWKPKIGHRSRTTHR
jgi:hypothetical protein